MKQESRFRKWHRNLKRMETGDRQRKILNFLNYATRTASFGLDSDSQRVIYAIRDRFAKSTYKRIRTRDLRKVFFMVNQHGRNIRNLKEENAALRKQLREQQPQVVRRTTRKIVSGGNRR